MPPICPIDNIPMVEFEGDASGGGYNFYECPRHGGRYVGYGFTLAPVPKAVISYPPPGKEAVVNLYRDSSTGTLEYTNSGGGGGSSTISGDMTYKELDASSISAGNSNLTNTNWGISKARIDYLSVQVSSGNPSDFDVAIYEKDTFLDADKRYEAQNVGSDGWTDDLEWDYLDRDNSNEIHLKITENTGAGTYTVHFRGVKLA